MAAKRRPFPGRHRSVFVDGPAGLPPPSIYDISYTTIHSISWFQHSPGLSALLCGISEHIASRRKHLRASGTKRLGAHKAHVHPSGIAEPSKADEYITDRVKQALALVDIKVLDHIIVAGGETMSFAERGLL
jgi:RadC-like JAB domain